jgi:hypothetical protein
MDLGWRLDLSGAALCFTSGIILFKASDVER